MDDIGKIHEFSLFTKDDYYKNTDVTHTILVWLFPFYLMAVEAIFRAIAGSGTNTFVGPAIATAGIGFLLPLTKHREAADLLGEKTAKSLQEKGGTVISTADQHLTPIVWLMILLGFLIWFWACYSAEKRADRIFFFMPEQFAIGFINYFIAAILAGVKSRL